MKISLPKIIVILGPTASGKSDLAIKLARIFNGEIVNADSRNIYKYMFIGTASPFVLRSNLDALRREQSDRRKEVRPRTIQGVKHHLFHFKEPWETYSVGQYKKDAIQVINNIIARGKLPILVGGTGLYIWAVVDNLEIPEVPPNLKLRKQLWQEIEPRRTLQRAKASERRRFDLEKIRRDGLDRLWKMLIKLDPEAVSFVQKDNPRRVIRALEVILTTGRKFSDLRQKGKLLYNALQIGLKISHQELYKRINKRVDQQMKDGLIEETKKLLRLFGCSNVLKNTRITNIWDLPSMTSLSYRQIGMYLRGRLGPKHLGRLGTEKPGFAKSISLEEATRLLKRDTRRYARRQMTWFRRDKRIKWTKIEEEVLERLRKFFSK